MLLKELVFFPKFTEYKGGNIPITLMSNKNNKFTKNIFSP